jgi:hypothetical protein
MWIVGCGRSKGMEGGRKEEEICLGVVDKGGVRVCWMMWWGMEDGVVEMC